MHAIFGTKQGEKVFAINAPIITMVVRDMLWDPDSFHEQTHANMMSCFEKCADDTEELEDGAGQDRNRVIIKKPLQFSLAANYLRVRPSLSQAARVVQRRKEVSQAALDRAA